jgi:hypothetical protein
MLRKYRTISEVAGRIEAAAARIIRDLQEGYVASEDDFTGRLLGAIEEALKEVEINGIVWRARRLTSNVKRSQESRFGADFIGLTDIAVRGYKTVKGFLVQAKLIKRADRAFTKSEWERLIGQCRKMLKLSPDAYVFVYSWKGIRVVPAAAVVAAADGRGQERVGASWRPYSWEQLYSRALYSRGLKHFFEEHLASFIGDPAIKAADEQELVQLMKQRDVRELLHLQGRER